MAGRDIRQTDSSSLSPEARERLVAEIAALMRSGEPPEQVADTLLDMVGGALEDERRALENEQS